MHCRRPSRASSSRPSGRRRSAPLPINADLERQLDALPSEARALVNSALPRAERNLSGEGVLAWVQGAKLMLEAGSGMAPVVPYLRDAVTLGYECGEDLLHRVIAVSLSILRRADARALDAFFASMDTARQHLGGPRGMHGYLALVEELSDIAARSLVPLLERMGEILSRLSLDGLRRWAMLGVQRHAADAGGQDAWFALESHEARALLAAAGEGVLFADVERRLGFYLRSLWNREPALRAGSDRDGGKTGRRVSIIGGGIRMPRSLEVLSGQDGPTLYRAAAAHAAAHLAYSTHKFPIRGLRPIQVALVSLLEDARVERLAMREMPGLARLWRPFHAAVPAFAATATTLMARLARGLIDETYEDDNPFVAKGRRMFAEIPHRLADPTISREIGNLLGNDIGQMRVQFNFMSYLVEPIYRDDNVWLWDFGDAGQSRADDREAVPQAVDLVQEEGGEKTEHAFRESGDRDAMRERKAALTAAEPEEDRAALEETLAQPHHYDEWDYLIQLDRPAWCTLRERPVAPGDPRVVEEILARNGETVNRLASMIKAVQTRRPRRLNRQLDGDRLDLGACIEAAVELRSGRAPDPRVHQRMEHDARDMAVLLLIDLSKSTEEFVSATRTTVLDLARQACVLVADAMMKLGDDFAIHGFNSNGRHRVEYFRFKDFGLPYDQGARARLSGMNGRLSTRLGAALRHAGRFLRYRRCAHKLVLLLTDGRPHDVDVQDEQYLVFDSKRAVEELRCAGVISFCLSLDHNADGYVTRIFGARNYVVVDSLQRLPEKLPALYLRLTR
jgi:nitric oxide reductase activation protein